MAKLAPFPHTKRTLPPARCWLSRLALLAFTTIFMSNPTLPAADAPKASVTTSPPTQLATLGGGCFWCLEAVFERVDGIKSVTSGYAGGTLENPSYKDVCGGQTGHAEVIQIEFDPARISYEKILDLFWESHDPTTLNRQGPDAGTQYRSIILFHDEAQKIAAEKSKKAVASRFSAPIVTEIVALKKFYAAEAYHQDYFRNNPKDAYCVMVISPKLKKLDKAKQP
jgi:peptide-methionine (S)-S-oxide reductase